MRYYPAYTPTEKGVAILKVMVENTLRKSEIIRQEGFTTAELSKLVGFPVYGATMRNLVGHYIDKEYDEDNKIYYTLLGGNTVNLLFFNFITQEEAKRLEMKDINN